MKSDKIDKEGLKGKFYVNRVDGRDDPGGDRADAKYFVLDYKHDKFAIQALKYYAFICKDEHPQLATDLWMALREAAK